MCRTQDAFGDLVVEKHADNVLDLPDQPGSYFTLIPARHRRIVDEHLMALLSRDDLEGVLRRIRETAANGSRAKR